MPYIPYTDEQKQIAGSVDLPTFLRMQRWALRKKLCKLINCDKNDMKSWYKNWDVISPIFKFSMEVRKIIYTTNAIESLNSGYRRLNKQRSVFPSDTALLKALYLATHEIAKKWTVPLRNWGRVRGELYVS